MEIRETELITEPPFYRPEFETAFRYIIDDYQIAPREIAVFLPCALKKPYSASPSHRNFQRILDATLDPERYHKVIFGSCGVVPSELELMYPFAHYHFMLGKITDQKVRADFLEIETRRLSEFLEKTQNTYQIRIAYCIGIFREAMEQACAQTGTEMILLPTRGLIDEMIDDDCPFPEGSLSMKEYLEEWRAALSDL